jgi:hypothetical protein
LKKFVGDFTLDEALDGLGLGEISSLMRIEIEVGEMPVEFSGWSSVADGSLYLTLVQDTR